MWLRFAFKCVVDVLRESARGTGSAAADGVAGVVHSDAEPKLAAAMAA